MNLKNIHRLSIATILLVASAVAACTSHTSESNSVTTPIAMQPPIRIIFYFQQAASESKQLTSYIADVCHCLPVFIGSYSSDALIYEIALPQNQNFAIFEKALMQHPLQFGIKLLEQDRIMQHQ
jgi:hypothetical protein